MLVQCLPIPMKLRQLKVTNLRSLVQLDLSVPDLAILIGRNDTGKSNTITAIQLLCEGSAASIRAEDFFADGSITIEATFAGVRQFLPLIEERNRVRLEERILEGDTITIRRIATGPKELGAIEIKDADGEFGRPTGIDAPLRAILPEIIHVDVLADVADQVKGTQKDALGQIVGQVLEEITPEVETRLSTAMAEANALLNVVHQNGREIDERAAQLRETEGRISQLLQSTFPEANVRLKVSMPTAKGVLSDIEVRIREGSHDDPYYRRGNGIQRVLYLSLLQALAELLRRNHETRRPFLLLFEEPEAFLHPEAQLRMRAALDAISRSPIAQVIVTTHSPILVTPEKIEHVIRLQKARRDAQTKSHTVAFGPVVLQEQERDLLRIFELQRSSKFLFASGVLLVEGIGDEHLFAAAAERASGFRCEASDMCVVEMGGKDSVPAFTRVLASLGLKVRTVVDLDFLWRGAGSVFQGDARYVRFMNQLRQRIPDLEANATDGEKRRIKRERIELCRGDLRLQRDDLCNALAEQGILVLRNGEIEDYVGLSHNTKNQYLKAAQELRSGARELQHRDDIQLIVERIRA
jgi:predicted ATP-dependent endonuclease of OLD family